MEKPQCSIVNFSAYTWRRKEDKGSGFYTTQEKEDAFTSFMESVDALKQIGPQNESGYADGLFSIAWVFSGLFFIAAQWSKDGSREDVKAEAIKAERKYRKALRISKEYGNGQEVDRLFISLIKWLSTIE